MTRGKCGYGMIMEQMQREREEQRSLKLPASDPTIGRYVLHYNPERATFTGGIAASAQKYFSGFVWTVVVSIAVLSFGFCAGLGNLAIGLIFCLVLGALVMLELSRPTNLEFTSYGFRVHWLHNLFLYAGPWIAWQHVTAVEYKEASVPGIENAECFE
ncbi:MAG: hypothetical protein C0507_14095, partial [Cyanobacteria bacterium PR.3.49]|nr:hypothetical protein [Cyanobacteria bacterium PR.3.49]